MVCYLNGEDKRFLWHEQICQEKDHYKMCAVLLKMMVQFDHYEVTKHTFY